MKIGLEIHIKLNTQRKLFCFCDHSEKDFNTNTCCICLGFPGTLPVLNQEVIKYANKLVRYFNSDFPKYLSFDRKHYTYADLPKGYQITQQDFPIGKNGGITIIDSYINIDRIAIEEDAAKSIIENGKRVVDFNRSGTPLLEMCTHPDFKSIDQVISFLKILRFVCEDLELIDPKRSDCLRCDVNISLQGGKKVEIKNVNSLGAIKMGLEYEIFRQQSLLDKNEVVVQETRSWNGKITLPMRNKETINQYFFIPEYNIPNFEINSLLKLNEEKETNISANNWNIFFRYSIDLDVERTNKLITLSRKVNLLNLEKYFIHIKDNKKTVDLLFFSLIENNFYSEIENLLIENKLNDTFKDIKLILNKKEVKTVLNEEYIYNVEKFIDSIINDQKDIVVEYQSSPESHKSKSLFNFFVSLLKDQFGKDNINSLINILKNKLNQRN